MTVYYGRSASQFLNDGAFAGVRVDGSVVAWGNPETGGELGEAAAALDGSVEVVEITSNAGAFAALLADGSVVAWGDARFGGDTAVTSGALDGGNAPSVSKIYSTDREFAAVRDDGSVVIWGGEFGDDSSGITEIQPYSIVLNEPPHGTVGGQAGPSEYSPVTDVAVGPTNTGDGFVFLREDGSGFNRWIDGSIPNFEDGGRQLQIGAFEDPPLQAEHLFDYAPEYALFNDGTVQNVNGLSLANISRAFDPQLPGVRDPEDVVTNAFETAVLSSDGSVTTFDQRHDNEILKVTSSEQAVEIYANDQSFAILLDDGSVRTWNSIFRDVTLTPENDTRLSELNAELDVQTVGRVVDVAVGERGFSAVREDGSVVNWHIDTGISDFSDADVDDLALDFTVFEPGTDPIETVFSSGEYFLGQGESGQLYSWFSRAEDITFSEQFSLNEDGLIRFGIGGPDDPGAEIAEIIPGGDNIFSVLRSDGTVEFGTVSFQSVANVEDVLSPDHDLGGTTGAPDDGAPTDPDTSQDPEQSDEAEGPVGPEGPEVPEAPETPSSRYQPRTEDLEIAARLVAYQRLGSQPEDYHAFGSAGNTSTYIADQGYQFEVLSQGSPDEGFFAVGMTSPTAEPILAIRGSSNADDWASNFEPDGVGRSQVDESWDDIVDWIARSTEQGEPLNITGHSQGGAQTQYIASRLTSDDQPILSDLSLGTLATFNSPGIAQSDALQFDNSDVRDVTHFVSSGDVVSLTGEAFIEGSVEYLRFDKGYSDGTTSLIEYVSTAHTGFWAQQSLNQEIGSVFTFDANQFVEAISVREDIFPIQDFNSSQDLNSPAFSYINSTSGNFDAEYDQWLNDVDNSLAYLSTWGPIFDGPIVRVLSSEDSEQEILSEVASVLSDIEGLSWVVPDGGGLVERIVTEDIRVLYGDNFERILEISDLINGHNIDRHSPTELLSVSNIA